MAASIPVVFLRYWGSHFKNPRQAAIFLAEFQPLLALGWRCHLVLERPPEDLSWLQGLLDAGVALEFEARPRSSYDRQAVFRAYRLCQRVQATIMVCDNIHLPPLLGAFLARVPVRIWWKRAMNGCYEEMRQPGWKEKLAFTTRLTCFLASRVFVVSSAVKKELLQLGLADAKIIVRCNPRKLGAGARTVSRVTAQTAWGFSAEHTVIATVGHAVPVKGWDLLLRAFAVLAARLPSARLLLVGSYGAPSEQTFFAELQTFISSHGLSNQVTLSGHLTDVRSALAAADIFVLSSRSEGCANALVEALEVGLPCITTRVGNADEVVMDGQSGLVVERGDQNGLTEALLKMALDPSLRLHMARNVRLPSSILSLEDYVAQLSHDYHRLVASTARGGLVSVPSSGPLNRTPDAMGRQKMSASRSFLPPPR